MDACVLPRVPLAAQQFDSRLKKESEAGFLRLSTQSATHENSAIDAGVQSSCHAEKLEVTAGRWSSIQIVGWISNCFSGFPSSTRRTVREVDLAVLLPLP